MTFLYLKIILRIKSPEHILFYEVFLILDESLTSQKTKYLQDMLHCTCSSPEEFSKNIIFGLKFINDWCK